MTSDDDRDHGAQLHHGHGHGHDHDHDHPHGHDHEHSHDDSAVTETRPRGGPVMLDIGGDIGAVIARLDDNLDGTELPILSLDDPHWDPNTHTGVWRRPLGSGSAVVAVYPELHAGRYRITPPHGTPSDFTVTGGQITEIDLRVQT